MSIFHEGHPNAFCISDGRKQGRKLSKGSSISWGVKLVNLCCKMSYEWPPCLIQNPLSWLRFLFHIHESPNIPIGFLPTCWNIFLGYASESFKVYLHHQEDDLSLGKPWRRLFRWKALWTSWRSVIEWSGLRYPTEWRTSASAPNDANLNLLMV